MNSSTPSRCSLCLAATFFVIVPNHGHAQDTGPVYQWTTLAGRASLGLEDGPGADARFNNPRGMAFDAAGNLYIADTGNHTIRMITPAGVVSTIAGTAGNAGSADGPGPTARFDSPQGVAVDGSGNVYVADTGNHTIRKITPARDVTTLTGQAGQPGSADGDLASALFTSPRAIVVDNVGNIYVYDATLRQISGGTVRTILGNGPLTLADGSNVTVWTNGSALAVDAAGQVYCGGMVEMNPLYHPQPFNTIFRVEPGGAVSVIFNPSEEPFPTGGAYVTDVTQLAVDGVGNLTAIVATQLAVAHYQLARAAGEHGFSVLATILDGAGADSYAWGIAVGPTGETFLSRDDNVIEKVTASGAQAVVAGTPRGPWSGLSSVASDSLGNIWAGAENLEYPGGYPSSAPMLLKVAPDGTAMTPIRPNVLYKMNVPLPVGVAVDGSDNVYFADNLVLPVTLFAVSPAGGITSTNPSQWPYAAPFAADHSGNLVLADSNAHVLWKRTPNDQWSVLAGAEGMTGADDGHGGLARFGFFAGITIDRRANLYVLDSQYLADGSLAGCFIRRITPDGDVSTVSKDLALRPAGDSPGFVLPNGIAVDSPGAFYLAYNYDRTVRRLDPEGVETIVGGVSGQTGSTDGLGSVARFVGPMAIAFDLQDNLYVGDGFDSSTIRKAQPAGPPVITAQPHNTTVPGGNEAQFAVTARGVPTPTYQWFFNGAAIGGATTKSLSIPGAQSANAGQYTVVVSNALGSVTSSAATLLISAESGSASPASSGGGALALWFVSLLAMLAAVRLAARRPSPPAERRKI